MSFESYFAFCLLLQSLRVESIWTDLSNASSLESVPEHGSDLCERNWLNVISMDTSQGRKLIEALNMIPSVIVYGENKGHLRRTMGLGQMGETPVLSRGEPFRRKWLRKKTLLKETQELLLKSYGHNDVDDEYYIGYTQHSSNLDGDAEFMAHIFPCGKFILAYQGKPQHSGWMSSEWKKDLVNMEKFHSFTNAFRIDLDNISAVRLNEMLKWMGISECYYFQRDQELLLYSTRHEDGSCTFRV